MNEDARRGNQDEPATAKGLNGKAVTGLWWVTEPTRENPRGPSTGSPGSPGALIEKLRKVGT